MILSGLEMLGIAEGGWFQDTHIEAGHVDSVAYNHINELIGGTILSEEDLSIEDF